MKIMNLEIHKLVFNSKKFFILVYVNDLVVLRTWLDPDCKRHQ